MIGESYFATLNEALESENLIEHFPIGISMAYGVTLRVITDNGLLISIYRDGRGRYERPLYYQTGVGL
jgi:hypothetical protein